jgi:undecaprenyl phosphate-alpha-L-ara4FN deformylase
VKVGLRIDVDTYRGTRLGVPALCRMLGDRGIRASFFFSVGPDNMGRHLWRLLRPSFAAKMLRTRAASLYGWDILFRGTLWPGPVIGKRLAPVLRQAADGGHEIGLHAWDHHAWQAHIDHMSGEAIREHLSLAYDLITRAAGAPPTCSAAPGWRCPASVLLEKERFDFAYDSDCRGDRIFYPVVSGRRLSRPQIPVSLPTYDEAVGRDAVTDASYNDWLLDRLAPDGLNVLTVHAEVEGIVHETMFARFLDAARDRGAEVVPLGALLPAAPSPGEGRIEAREIPGREGPVACLVA